ncbi:hypothetical protein AB6A40_002965 [Gnathostoma spinigerum]|uniref:Cilia- and flagella-associated protein 36 n=1 Tax=Gnathostoma spinigerum TaxID=75299 RepID=A0ABD6EFS2_9BILA
MLRRRLSKDDLSPKNIFRKFLDFLNSSVWNLPLSMFIEQKSVVFDQEQENPELYETIHKEYSALIDTLIECFCDDLHITVNQLIASLKHDDNKARLTEEQQVLLEPVLAAQDMNTFVAMMIRKNVELQLQALQMIELVCGLVPSVLDVDDEDLLEDKGKPRRKTGWSPKEETERYILIKVLRQSKLDYERDEAARREAKIQLERALKESLYDRQQFQLASNSDEKTLIEVILRFNVCVRKKNRC